MGLLAGSCSPLPLLPLLRPSPVVPLHAPPLAAPHVSTNTTAETKQRAGRCDADRVAPTLLPSPSPRLQPPAASAAVRLCAARTPPVAIRRQRRHTLSSNCIDASPSEVSHRTHTSPLVSALLPPRRRWMRRQTRRGGPAVGAQTTRRIAAAITRSLRFHLPHRVSVRVDLRGRLVAAAPSGLLSPVAGCASSHSEGRSPSSALLCAL